MILTVSYLGYLLLLKIVPREQKVKRKMEKRYMEIIKGCVYKNTRSYRYIKLCF